MRIAADPPRRTNNGVNRDRERGEHEIVYIVDDRERDGGGIKVIVDSGAGVNVVSSETVKKMQEEGEMIMYTEDGEREYIEFGNVGSKEAIIGVIRGKGMVEKMAVVENVSANLVGVRQFTEKGMEVTFIGGNVYVRYKGAMVIEGRYSNESRMYEMDLRELMELKDPREEKEKKSSVEEERRWVLFKAARVRFTARAIRAARKLHQDLKHMPYWLIAKMIEDGVWKDIDPEITPALLRMMEQKGGCLTCAETRWNQIVEVGSGINECRVGTTFTWDYVGKIRQTSRRCNGFNVIRDVGSGLFKIYGVKDGKTAVMESIRQWCLYMISHGHRPRRGWSDSGSVETAQGFKEAMAEMGLQQLTTAPYQPNKAVERTVQTILNDVAAIMKCTPNFKAHNWLDAAHDAATLRNMTTNEASRQWSMTKSAIELVEGKPADLREYLENGPGKIVVVKTPMKDRRFGMAKNQAAMVVRAAIDGTSNAQVQMLDTGVVCRRGGLQGVHQETREPTTTEQVRKVHIVYENGLDGIIDISMEGDDEPLTTSSIMAKQRAETEKEVRREDEQLREKLATKEDGHEESTAEDAVMPSKLTYDQDMWGAIEGEEDKEAEEFIARVLHVEDARQVRRRSDEQQGYADDKEEGESGDEMTASASAENYWSKQRGILTSEQQEAVNMHVEIYGDNPEEGTDDEEEGGEDEETDDAAERRRHVHRVFKMRQIRGPNNPTVAMLEKDPQLAKAWQEPMKKEYDGISQVSEVVSEEEAMEKGVTRKVTVMNTKRDGEKKCRMNIDGREEQRQGVFEDMDKLFSPAMDEELLKFILAYAAYYGLHIEKSDVVQCFLNNDMDNAAIQRDIILAFKEIECNKEGGEYRRMNVVGYGACDASREWYDKFDGAMVEMGMMKSVFHPCLYVKLIGEKSILMVGVATDDMLKACTKDKLGKNAMQWFNEELDKRWQMKHFKEVGDILGVNVVVEADGSITATQPAQAAKIQDKYFPEGTPQTIVPMHPDMKKPSAKQQEPFREVSLYQQATGMMGYSRVTRHDSLTTISKLAERNVSPRNIDYEAALWLAAYLVTTHKVGLRFQAGPANANIREAKSLRAYADASWGSSSTHHSQLGVAIYVTADETEDRHARATRYTAPIYAKSSKEKTPISESVAAAELKAQMKGVGATEILRGMAEEVAGIADRTTIKAVPEGTANPTEMVSTNTSPDVEDIMVPKTNEPTDIHLDNAALASILGLTMSKKERALKRLSRWLQYLRSRVKEGLVRVVSVRTKDQLANPLTKTTASPTEHWRESEWILGTQEAVTEMQEMARKMAKQRKSSRTSPPVRWHQIRMAPNNAELSMTEEVEERDDTDEEETASNTIANAETTEATMRARNHAQSKEAKGEQRKSRKRRRSHGETDN